VSLTVSENRILSIPLVFDLEFEDHAVGIWRRNLAPEIESWGEEIMIEGRTMWARTVDERDSSFRQIYDD